ncbi:MAG TPA: 50S ribosomal protein L24 [Candidatus Methanoculleus thermohydrogenotrophicum]|jgi:large subunit ribosomal protein L24|nr:50S ribosomal protein L24 [Candidatus Methanoculleus thermohydrogenotrophicum]NLM81703.1 50S ribosomal protein L24 [Candidatus Methanoculleus thermohydrogenotrophicum]HOB17843.1 50S ribosomal protein L24 [Candidatus Methanoculleus thermohydrogenotrophicum]HPZ37386.1 50S ribosomal protein L24 [Candidatus Methanoculleus thermohydrogenotrophicum]HQC91258.1 50S ribosomal protein L24 [Candidatus Methanoculleus thermohydrogenotrophicum]
MVRTTSKQPRKQRKARFNAPNHARGQFLTASLSHELREKYNTRRVRVVKGDTVRVLRGDYTGEEGVVDAVDMKRCQLIVHGVMVTKADGTEVPRPVDPSNVQITKLNLKDKLREERLGGGE